MKATIFSFLMTISLVSLTSCKKDLANARGIKRGIPVAPPTINLSAYEETGGCPAQTTPLIAGQHIDAGTVTVINDAAFIYVTYTTANDYYLTETHLYVGNCEAIPVTRAGNPSPGQFPYKNSHDKINTFTYQVPISAIPLGTCACIAAHAAVVKLNNTGQIIDSQTGWGSGSLINPNGGNWGMKFQFCSCEGGS